MPDVLDEWDTRRRDLAGFVAKWSKDPNARVGTVIADRHGRVIALGYNGFSTGVEDSVERLANKEQKLEMILHAEVNAVLIAGRSAEGGTIYVVGKPVCSRRAGVMIQAGIRRVVAENPDGASESQWAKSGRLAIKMFNEACVKFTPIPQRIDGERFMPKILIDPVTTKTKGDLDAEINGIDPSSDDCVCGKVKGDAGWQSARWDTSGIMRGGVDATNFDPQEDDFREVMDLIDSIKKLAPKPPKPIMTPAEEKFMAFEGLAQWTQAVVTQSARVSAARERQAALDMASTPAQRRQAIYAFHAECNFFAAAAHKLLEFRDWVLTFGLCASVNFDEIGSFSARDIRDLRNMREHVVDYFRGAGNARNRWEVETPEYKADASSVVGTMIGGRLDWVAFGAAAERLLPQLLAEPVPYLPG